MTCHAARRMPEFEWRLWKTRCEVGRALATADVELAGLEPDRPTDVLDAAARDLACGVLARLEARDHEALAEIEAAERRLTAGTYGTCEECGGAIPPARLRALPATRLCVSCETAVETAAR
jgi:RNA polymerase-binding transcription factor DksA